MRPVRYYGSTPNTGAKVMTITAPRNARVYLAFLAMPQSRVTLNSMTWQRPGKAPQALPAAGWYPYGFHGFYGTRVNNPENQGASNVPQCWPLEYVLDAAKTLTLAANWSQQIPGQGSLALLAMGWLLYAGEAVPSGQHWQFPHLPSQKDWLDQLTAPAGLPAAPAPQSTPGTAFGVAPSKWSSTNPAPPATTLKTGFPNYPTSLDLNFTTDNPDPATVTIAKQFGRVFAALTGQGLNAARLIRASMTGGLHAHTEFLQADQGTLSIQDGSPQLLYPSPPWERLILHVEQGDAVIQTINAAEASQAIDITAVNGQTLKTGQTHVLDREISLARITPANVVAAATPTWIRYTGER